MKPNRKLKKPISPHKLVLGHVIGITANNANGFESSESSSNCVYIAGCVAVVYDGNSGSQSSLMVTNRIPKPLSCATVSKDGRFVAAGESGDQAAVLVWDCNSSVLLSELKSHQHGVECIAFSPDGKLLVSIGFPNDGYISLWNWRSGILVTRLKACSSRSSVESVCFSSDSNFIVTAGKKHLKIWKIISSARTRANLGVKSMSMHGKPINLRKQKGCSFIAVKSPILADNNLVNFGPASETLPIYGLTDSGVLCVISGSSIRKSVDVKVKKAFALTASNKMIACACNNGLVKLFSTESLDYCGNLRYNEWKNCKEEDDSDSDGKSCKNDLKLLPTLPHAIACQFSTSEKLVVVYGDNSIYIWDICDLQKVNSRCVLVSHSGCIWDIKCLPCENMHSPSLACPFRGCFGGTSFATCSEDGTVRLWNLSQTVCSMSDQTLVTNSNSKLAKPAKPIYIVNSEIFQPESEVRDSSPGYRSMEISLDGKYLVVSDMANDSTTEVVVTVGQDKKVNIFSSDTGRLIRSFKQGSDFGDVIKVTVDKSSSFLACSYSNRSICIYDFMTGEIAARAVGHGEVITGIIFLPDYQHLVSVSGDGCIFVWRLSTLMSSRMLQKIKENSRSSSPPSNEQHQIDSYEDSRQSKFNLQEVKQIESFTPVVRKLSCQEVGLHEISVFKFSISRLPKWAQDRAINRVVDPGHYPAQQIGNSSAVGSHDCSNLQIPPKNVLDGCQLSLDSISAFSSDTNTSQGSQSPQEAHRRSFALDRRWLTIHTVCLDSLTSPGVFDMKMMVNTPKVSGRAQPKTIERFKQPIVGISSSFTEHQDEDKLNHNSSNLSAKSKDLQNLVPNQCFISQSELANCSTLNQQKREEQDTIIACKEALLNMENAIDNAFQLFSKLRNLAIKGDLSDCEAVLYSQAAGILPSATMKFNAVTKMAVFQKKTCGEPEILKFDPSNAKNCSQEAAEVLKED